MNLPPHLQNLNGVIYNNNTGNNQLNLNSNNLTSSSSMNYNINIISNEIQKPTSKNTQY